MKLISDWQNKKLTCDKCKTTKSVKYESGNNVLCNKCILEEGDIMNRIAESFTMEVMYNNGIIKKYEMPFKKDIEVTKETFKSIVNKINHNVQECYENKVGAYLIFENDIIVTINLSETSSIEFYLNKK